MKLGKLSAIIDKIPAKLPSFTVNMLLMSVNWVQFPGFAVKSVKSSEFGLSLP